MVQSILAEDWAAVAETMESWQQTDQVEWFDRAMVLRDAINDQEWEKVVALATEWDCK